MSLAPSRQGTHGAVPADVSHGQRWQHETNLHDAEEGDFALHDFHAPDLVHVIFEHLVVVGARKLPLFSRAMGGNVGEEHSDCQ